MVTAEEWSLAFDILWNNLMSNQAPGITLYEKGVLLTRAQEALVKDIFSPKTNALAEGFDDSERRQSDFSSLMQVVAANPIDSSSVTNRLDKRSVAKYYEYPDDMFIVLNEVFQSTLTSGGISTVKTYDVVPLSYTEYSRLMRKPYKFPQKGIVWRLFGEHLDNGKQVLELIGKFPSDQNLTFSYTFRYVRRPAPIVLETQTGEEPSIEGETTESSPVCELPEHLHEEILYRAVQLAKVAWIDNPSQINNTR